MNDSLTEIRSILVELLTGHGQVAAAHLKPRLAAELLERVGIVFDERGLGYKNFLTFLQSNKDIIEVNHPGGPGSVWVSLKTDEISQDEVQRQEAIQNRLPVSVWQAFTNPDPNRKRFYNKEKGIVIHYLEGSARQQDFKHQQEVDIDTDYIEITPISSDQHSEWMKNFLSEHNLAPRVKEVCETIANSVYSSAVNYAFTQSLGRIGESWKLERSKKVHDFAIQWANENNIDFWSAKEVPQSISANRPASSESFEDDDNWRVLIKRAIDLMGKEELARVSIPASAVVRLLRRHSGKSDE